MNPLVCAYIGDAIYEVYIREYLINKGITKLKELQSESIKYVSASSQRRILEDLESNNILTEEELDIVKWGRNAKGSRSKHSDIITYKIATGLETLIGYLYLNNNKERIDSIMSTILK